MQTISPNPKVLSRSLDAIDGSWYTWEPEAILDAAKDAGYDPMDIGVRDMAGALSVLRALPDRFWSEWEVFENIGQALNGNVPDFAHVQPLSPAEAAFAVGVARELVPGEMSYEVKTYVEAILHSNGLSFGVTPLEDITDRSSNAGRRQAVLERYNGFLDQGASGVSESGVDIEALKLLAITTFVQDNLTE